MSWLGRQLARATDLGPRDDPRKIAVGRRVVRESHPVVSTPGARVRIVRAAHAPELQLAVLWCHRNGNPMDISDGDPGVWIDGRRASLDDLRRYSPDESGSAR